jgi:hypothetical protein
MFPLYLKNLPATGNELAVALEASLRRILSTPGRIVSVRETGFPSLDEIAIHLDDARATTTPPKPSLVTTEGGPPLSVGRLTLTAQRVYVGDALLNLSMDAENVVLGQGRDANGDVVLLVQRADRGHLTISILQTDLEAIISRIAKVEAARRGATIDDVRVKLKLSEPRVLAGEVRALARKSFFRATVHLSGKLAIDQKFTARIFDLACKGEGAIAALACSVLESHLQKLNGREFELTALGLGEVQIRDIRVEVDNRVAVTALFGSSTG